eukprot:TRINITY_DN12680_c0_g1_i1.p1 TRINITY_DN12680_c0_g1~~TRINITY_DN12680_c0_g1_i1.p1  ORF type:complete len:479 (-),score=131.58 TRINITY_DN12680_c0_g1_i1:68-1483(-)
MSSLSPLPLIQHPYVAAENQYLAFLLEITAFLSLMIAIFYRDAKVSQRQRFYARAFSLTGLTLAYLLPLVGIYFPESYIFLIVCSIVAFLSFSPRNFGYLVNPQEVWAMILFKLTYVVPPIPSNIDADQTYSYKKLTQVSRSFSAVILHLNEELRESICIFYLVCRGLDSIEDDMAPPAESKSVWLKSFHEKIYDDSFTLKGFGEVAHEIDLLENQDKVNRVFLGLKEKYQLVIADVAKQMGDGMAKYLTKDVKSIKDYNEYCWIVAGLVGEGLTRLIEASGLEDPSFEANFQLYNSMGLFLQKTNITRDYLEDLEAVNPRIWWPREITDVYVEDVAMMKLPKYRAQAIACLNHMVTNAIEHAIDCIDYLDAITEPSVFQFCAIPQTMAISTLALCYNNYDVFKKEVKIRKGEAVVLIQSSNNMSQVLRHFYDYSNKIAADIPNNDPNAAKLHALLLALKTKITTHPKYII